ncbi:competence/damage-inducible protein A, partial [candidate division WOR-3 bacterium]|nr:competence/damage-inducible protein A [candidate division WOR-3 bacterium]
MLSGRVVDTNSAFLGRALADVGLRLSRIIKVGDSEMDIRAALRPARAGVVFVCGGLGPTPDDRTMAAVARELRLRLATDNELVEQMKARFRRRGKSMPGLARRQAQVPSGARLLENPAGMVPGVVVERGRRLAILLPGVPQEFRAVVTTGVVPFLIERYRPRPPETLNVRAFGVPESRVAERLAPVLRGLPRVQPAFYPS